MGRIHLLDDQVINKIAAGEVVERPASVVKELVENALDAGAENIIVSLDQGGIKRIVVTDDGFGMDRADARLALQRHATSKIKAADDLFTIKTMGFRGEALASIAAVSRFSLASTPQLPAVSAVGLAAPEGIKLQVGDDGSISEWPWPGPVGSTIVVEDLFYNVPARSKFLKTVASEYAQCLELLQALALCHPRVGFTLVHNGREQFRVPAVLDARGDALSSASGGEQALRQRARSLFPSEAIDTLLYVTLKTRHGEIEMLASTPGVEKATARYMFTYVNGRWVKDKALRYGILRGYHSHLLKGRFPFVLAHLTVDPSLVDVNVHPAKTEVRFQYAQEIQSLIALALRDAIRQGAWAKAPPGETVDDVAIGNSSGSGDAGGGSIGVYRRPGTTDGVERSQLSPEPEHSPDYFRESAAAGHFAAGSGRVSPDQIPQRQATTVTRRVQSFSGLSGGLAPKRDLDVPAQPRAPLWDQAGIDALLRAEEPLADSDTTLVAAIPWHELTYLGTFDRCYLLFTARANLLVLDQHAFHERILYERLAKNQNLLTQTQPLLMPECVELSPTEVAALEQRHGELAVRGFEFKILNDTLLEINAVPSLLANKDLAALFADLAGVDSLDVYSEPADSNREMGRLVLATIACHAAVRAGEDLSADELKHLLAEAKTVDFYHNCPHGRRVFRWWSRPEVARWFDRS